MYPGKIGIEDRVFRPKSSIHPCNGCFECWTKTPGVCTQQDDAKDLGWLLSKCEELTIISWCFHGSFSPFVQMVIERTLPYAQPGMEIRQGRMRHTVRYNNHIHINVCFYDENITAEEKATAETMVKEWAEEIRQPKPEIHWYADAWQIGEFQ